MHYAGTHSPECASLHRSSARGPPRTATLRFPPQQSARLPEQLPTRFPTQSPNMTTSTPSDTWQVLLDHRRALAGRSLTSLFDADDARPARLSLVWDDWLADWSKQRLTPDAMNALVAHARERNLEAWIAALFAGEKINLWELRPALHTALRQPGDAPLMVDGADIMPAIRATQARMRALAAQLRGGLRLGATGRPIRSVIHLGIGGSDLGPAMVCEAL